MRRRRRRLEVTPVQTSLSPCQDFALPSLAPSGSRSLSPPLTLEPLTHTPRCRSEGGSLPENSLGLLRGISPSLGGCAWRVALPGSPHPANPRCVPEPESAPSAVLGAVGRAAHRAGSPEM